MSFSSRINDDADDNRKRTSHLRQFQRSQLLTDLNIQIFFGGFSAGKYSAANPANVAPKHRQLRGLRARDTRPIPCLHVVIPTPSPIDRVPPLSPSVRNKGKR